MSQDTTPLASAINLAELSAHSAEAIAALVQMVQRQDEALRRLRADFDALDRDLKKFKVFTRTGEVEELRERIAELEGAAREDVPGSCQADRAKVLRAVLAANGGKMPAKEARNMMKLDESTFSRLLATLKDKIEVRPLRANRRAHLLVLRSIKEG
jgi:HPt (histidine-containing phosphotransfer) domain-containing protein